MAFTNNVMIVRHGLLAKLVKLWKENRLLEEIDRLPIVGSTVAEEHAIFFRK